VSAALCPRRGSTEYMFSGLRQVVAAGLASSSVCSVMTKNASGSPPANSDVSASRPR
jgi:hypothetical protein